MECVVAKTLKNPGFTQRFLLAAASFVSKHYVLCPTLSRQHILMLASEREFRMSPGEKSEDLSRGCFHTLTLGKSQCLLLLGLRRESEGLGARGRRRHFKRGLIKDFFKGTVSHLLIRDSLQSQDHRQTAQLGQDLGCCIFQQPQLSSFQEIFSPM